MQKLKPWHNFVGGIVGSLMIWGMGQTGAVLALPPQEIQAKLQSIPVFAIANNEGKIWTIEGKDKAELPVFFVSIQDAQNSIEKIESEKPELKDKLKVSIISLGLAFQSAKNQNAQADFSAAFVPVEQQVDAATQILKQENQSSQQFQGVPLFFATITENNKEGYLVIQRQENTQTKTTIPLFFEKEELQKLVDQFKQSEPSQAANVKIRVIPLEEVIYRLEKENDEALKNMVLVPTQESEAVIQRIRQQQNQSQPSPSPSPNN